MCEIQRFSMSFVARRKHKQTLHCTTGEFKIPNFVPLALMRKKLFHTCYVNVPEVDANKAIAKENSIDINMNRFSVFFTCDKFYTDDNETIQVYRCKCSNVSFIIVLRSSCFNLYFIKQRH